MNGVMVEIATADGVANAYVSKPEGEGPWPGVLLFMDAIGLRPAMYATADRLASHGYWVLVPNLFYRAGPMEPLDPKKAFSGPGPELDRVMKVAMSLTDADAMRDVGTFFDFLEREPAVQGKKFGCVGYCLGGGLAFYAACQDPDRVAAVASFHGGRFLTDPSSPDVIAAKLRAPAYVGVAEIDHRHTAEVSANLESAMTKAGIDHTIELYTGAAHGWALSDIPVYDAAATERHWERLLAFFGKTLT